MSSSLGVYSLPASLQQKQVSMCYVCIYAAKGENVTRGGQKSCRRTRQQIVACEVAAARAESFPTEGDRNAKFIRMNDNKDADSKGMERGIV
jgi:hypothetical protein